METHVFRCMHCQTDVAVPEGAPEFITCPKCRGIFVNDLTPQAPIPVISLKRQVRSDQKTSLLLLIIIEVLTVLGIGTIIIYAGSPFGITIILMVIGTGIATYCLISLA